MLRVAVTILFASWIFSAPQVGQETPINSESYAETLTCPQVLNIARWGLRKHTNGAKAQMTSETFREQALKSLIQRMDPYRVILLQSEADQLVEMGRAHWERFVQRQRCEDFDRWISLVSRRATDRFKSHLKKIAEKPLRVNSQKEASRFSAFRNFAHTPQESFERAKRFAQWQVATISERALKAYGLDRYRLLEDFADEILFETQKAGPRSLLAKGLLGALDPYSTYFSKIEFEEYYADLSGAGTGIGIQVRKVPEGLLVEKVLQGSPASRSKKLKIGDTIVAVGGVQIHTLSAKVSKHMLRGDEGSVAKLKVRHENNRVEQIEIKRQVFAFEESQIEVRKKNDVTVIEVPSFYGRGGMTDSEERSSSEDLQGILSKMIKENPPKSLVLDLRGNPGGYLEEAVSMAGIFLGDRPVVGVKEQSEERVLRSQNTEAIFNGPLVVMIDSQTASASEVLAAALKDHMRAIVVGTNHSFGKGSVQRLFHLDDPFLSSDMGSARDTGVVKVTTSVFYSPRGVTPLDGGVQSDIVLAKAESPAATDEVLKDHESAVSPILDTVSLEELDAREKSWKSVVAELKRKSGERVSSENLSEVDLEIEATQIAHDLARLTDNSSTH